LPVKKDNKKRGIFPIASLAVVLGIFSTMFVMSIMPFFLLRIHLVQVIDIEYNYDNSQQALQALMSLTRMSTDIYGNTEYKTASRIVGDYSSDSSIDISFLGEELKKITANDIFECYRLTMDGEILAQGCGSGDDPPSDTDIQYEGTSLIATPSGIKILKLETGRVGGGGIK